MSRTLTKVEIVQKIQEQTGFQRSIAIDVFERLLEVIKGTLSSGEDVLVSGFGKFCVKQKNVRIGRNPATGEQMMIDPRKVVTFRCSNELREKINGNGNK
jgi:integration host factor subunit alpha